MAAAHPLTDHDEIRSWAEARGGKPTCVRGTGGKGDTGMIRLDFPGYSGEGKLQPISWDEWFDSFDENKLALLVQDTRTGGGKSNFNKLVARRTAAGRQRSRRSAGTSRSSASRSPRKKAPSRTKRTSGAKKTARSTPRASGAKRSPAKRTSARSSSRKRSTRR